MRAYTNPANVIPCNASSNVPNYASNTGNTAGRSSNRGYEGLAISPGGRHANAMLQGQMRVELGAPCTRIVKFDTVTGGAVAQYAYRFDIIGNNPGVSGLVAVNDRQFLVLERNNRGLGVDCTYAGADKRVYLIDLAGATDVFGFDLDAPGASFTAVTKAATPRSTLTTTPWPRWEAARRRSGKAWSSDRSSPTAAMSSSPAPTTTVASPRTTAARSSTSGSISPPATGWNVRWASIVPRPATACCPACSTLTRRHWVTQ